MAKRKAAVIIFKPGVNADEVIVKMVSAGLIEPAQVHEFRLEHGMPVFYIP